MKTQRLALAIVAAAALAGGLAPLVHADGVADISDDNIKTDFDPHVSGKTVTSVAIFSEGYKDQQEFMTKARSLAHQLRTDDTSAPFREVTTFEFHYVWIPSNDLGAPWRSGEAPRDTPFKAHCTKDGSLAVGPGLVDKAMQRVLGGTQPDAIAVVLIHLQSKSADKASSAPKVPKEGKNTNPGDVRDYADTPEDVYKELDRRGVCDPGGHEIGRVHQVDLDMRAFLHEFGHARFGLDDEYANDPDAEIPDKDRPGVALYPNNTTDPSGVRWKKTNPELFDADGKIKHIEVGGSGFGKGVWHAEHLCRMNQSRNQGFCKVCTAAIRGSAKDHGPFPAPAWVKPADGSKPPVVVSGKDRLLELSWNPATSEDPFSWHVELVGADGKTKWQNDVEGNLDATDMPAPAPGIYTLRLYGQRIAKANPDNRSPVVETRFRMVAQPTETTRDPSGGDRKGIAERLGEENKKPSR